MTTTPASPETTVLLATCADLPHGEHGGAALVEALAERGLEGRWVVWDDQSVDWTSGLVAVRATWDYETRLPEFLAWTRRLPRLLNSAELFAWNTDKAYLAALSAAGLRVVPTIVVEDESELPAAIAEVSTEAPSAVVKPRVAAGGRGVVVFDDLEGGPAELDEASLQMGPWVVQPLVESVRTEGEWSAYVIGGEVVSAALKRPVGEEIRVHEEYGGSTAPAEVTDELRALALAAVEATERVSGERLDYARIDALRLPDGALAVSEVEATEPGLYLDELPGNATAFAALCAQALERR